MPKSAENIILVNCIIQKIFLFMQPSQAQDLSGLPSAYISVFEYDPMRSEAVEYSEKLFFYDIPVELHIYAGAYHLAYLIPNSQISKRRSTDRIKIFEKIIGL